MPRRERLAILGPVLLSALLACSSVKQVELAYQPLPNGPLATAKAGPELLINKLKDNRGKPELGLAQNYTGHVFFTIHTSSDVSAWATRALATELGKAGCKVSVGEQLEDPGKYMVNGTINEIWNEGIVTTMRITLLVTRGTRIVSNRAYNADAAGFREKVINTVYTTDYANLYEVTLQNLLKQAVPQIVTAINDDAASQP